MCKVLLFILALGGTLAHATCASNLDGHVSSADLLYPSGFNAASSALPDLRDFDFDSRDAIALIHRLHAFSYKEAANATSTREELTALSRRALDRLLTFDDPIFEENYEELVVIAANLSGTEVSPPTLIPFVERLAAQSLLKRDRSRRQALVDYLLKAYLNLPGARPRYLHFLPEVIEQAPTSMHGLLVVARSASKQLARGHQYDGEFFSALVDLIPTHVDSRQRVSVDEFGEIITGLNDLVMVSSSLRPVARDRVRFLLQIFMN